MRVKADIGIDEKAFLESYNGMDDAVVADICSGTSLKRPFTIDDIPAIVEREIEGWLRGVVTVGCDEAKSNSFGGDTGIDADYAPDGYICQDCDDDIELGEETLIGQEMFCPDCVEKRVK